MRHLSSEIFTTRLSLKCHFESPSLCVRIRRDSDVELGSYGQPSRWWNLVAALVRRRDEGGHAWNQEATCDS
jgi:hypothetical protein